MSEAWHAALVGAGCSMGCLVFEVAFLWSFRGTNSSVATKVVFGVFVVAFCARMVFLLAGPKMSVLGVHDGHSFGLGVVFSFLLGVVFEAVLLMKLKR